MSFHQNPPPWNTPSNVKFPSSKALSTSDFPSHALSPNGSLGSPPCNLNNAGATAPWPEASPNNPTDSPATPHYDPFSPGVVLSSTPPGSQFYTPSSPKLPIGDYMLTVPPFCGTAHILRDHSPVPVTTSYHENRSSSVVTNPYELGYNQNIDPRGKIRKGSDKNWKYSPTPSYKRKTAERLLKEHGSPPGIRVTCGGRIVPDNLAPLTGPMFGYPLMNKGSNFYRESRFTSGHFAPVSAPPTAFIPPSGFVAYDMTGRLCQYINGKAEPVPIKNGLPDFVLPVSNGHSIVGAHGHFGDAQNAVGLRTQPYAPSPAPTFPFDTRRPNFGEFKIHNDNHIRALEDQRNDLERELRHLEKQSALHQRTMSSRVQNEVVRKRIELTNRIDETRKSILAVKDSTDEGVDQPANFNCHSYSGERTRRDDKHFSPAFPIVEPDSFGGVSEQSYCPAPYDFPSPQYCSAQANHFESSQRVIGSTLPDLGIAQAYLGSYEDAYTGSNVLQSQSGNAGLGLNNIAIDLVNVEDEASCAKQIHRLHYSGSNNQSRRSHAIQIKDPNQNLPSNTRKTSLDPTSPSYFPPNSAEEARLSRENSVPDESSFAPSPTLIAELESIVGDYGTAGSKTDSGDNGNDKSDDHERSSSSATTADFFPKNPSDYSHKKYAPNSNVNTNIQDYEEPIQHNFGAIGSPVTPRKSPHRYAWHSSPVDSQPDDAIDIDEHFTAGNRRRSRAPSNRPIAPPPSVDYVDNSCDIEPAKNTSFHQTAPDAGKARNTSAPMVLRSAMTSTPTKGDVQSNECNPNPSEYAGSQFLEKMAGSALTPVSSLLKEASERVAKLPGADEQYMKGYNDAIKHYMGRVDFSISNPNSASPSAKSKTASRIDSSSNLGSLNNTLVKYASPNCLASEFMSKPNVNVSSLNQQRQIGTQTSHSILRKAVPQPVSVQQHPEGRFKRCLPLTPNQGYDHQRYTKAQISVNASRTQARGFFQYDGSADDNPLTTDGNIEASKSPVERKRPKAADPPRSPIRETASAAYAKINKLISSPEKQKKRDLWKKRFTDLKAEEKKEIQNYKEKHPLPKDKSAI